MTNKQARNMSEIGQTCRRCKNEEAVLISRKEPFCGACFVHFIRGKQRKSMMSDDFKVKYGAKEKEITKVLLSLSCGSSSLVLLDSVVSMLKEQAIQHRSRQGFELVVAIIDTPSQQTLKPKEFIQKFKESVETSNLSVKFKIFEMNSMNISKDEIQTLKIDTAFQLDVLPSEIEGDSMTLTELLDQFSSKSTKQDFASAITRKLCFGMAKSLDCGFVLLGHSMTRLAVEVLSLTVRGRGSEIGDALHDGEVSSESGLRVIYPLRDVLLSEIEQYIRVQNLTHLVPLESPEYPKRLLRNSSIDEMIWDYFKDVGTNYAEVVSTVVKIGDKLTSVEVGNPCKICGELVADDPSHWLRKITVNEPFCDETVSVQSPDSSRSKPSSDEVHQTICYACIVNMVIEPADQAQWPRKTSFESDVLEEYIIDDDD
ncbi:unnamed protein product [Kuraishia capsulata CBS 1993]|uniref:Cytoplasmic tRNA 2-thiolation protein 2 n=1 Tax=Kuraishia capsulata CBS 1993 TaxID=1382522 RepID=W6MSI7_9ASCO|nr:uncharacterized protein KUCA_T00005672001 [Kuraishia capsulata CBS 1993]CDK29679.1 unnamed protein product [Kuraishia capsulata CBS 1993]